MHHAGYYTLQNLKKDVVPQAIVDRAFMDCLVINTEDYHQAGDFLFDMAMKVARTTVGGLGRKWKSGTIATEYPTEAMQQLLTGIWDVLDEVEPSSYPDRAV